MSTSYYLYCNEHKDMVFIFDNKANQADDTDKLRAFIDEHIICNKCTIRIIDEYSKEWDDFVVAHSSWKPKPQKRYYSDSVQDGET